MSTEKHSHADKKPAANTLPPTNNPASAQQTSANLIQSTVELKLDDPAADGKRTGTVTIHLVVQPNDPRSEQAILFAALQDEFQKAKAGAV